jgi:nucleotide-binding universal stress UspA family protein
MKTKMYRKILVPLDGSELSEKALPHAVDIAQRFSGDITLLYVRLPAEDPYHPELQSYLNRTAEELKKKARSTSASRETDIKVEFDTVSAGGLVRRPAEAIVRYSDENGINLIVMASHGHSGIRHWALGGTSDKVLRMSSMPVLLVRAGGNSCTAFDRIIVPLDGSETAECVFPHVKQIASVHGSSRIVLLHVIESTDSGITDGSGETGKSPTEKGIPDSILKNKAKSMRYLRRIKKQTGLENDLVKIEVLEGNVAESIVDYTAGSDTDLIIMSNCGSSGETKWPLGSIADRVLNHSDAPVLLVKAG